LAGLIAQNLKCAAKHLEKGVLQHFAEFCKRVTNFTDYTAFESTPLWVYMGRCLLQNPAKFCKILQSTFFKVFCSIFQVLSNLTH